MLFIVCFLVYSSILQHIADVYGRFPKFHVCFCGLDPDNLKLETVRTNEQHICF